MLAERSVAVAGMFSVVRYMFILKSLSDVCWVVMTKCLLYVI